MATVLIAVVLVAATKGCFEQLGSLHFRMLWLLLIALRVQVVLEFVDFPANRIDDVGLAILLASYALIFAFCSLNRRTSGMLIIGLGESLHEAACQTGGPLGERG